MNIDWPNYRYQRIKGKRTKVPYQRLFDAGKLDWNPATHVCAEQIAKHFNIHVQRVDIPEMVGHWVESGWGLLAFSVPIETANLMAPHWQAIRDREDASRKQRKKRPSRAEILRRHQEDVASKKAAGKPKPAIAARVTAKQSIEEERQAAVGKRFTTGAGQTPDKLNVEDAEAGLDATALPESQTSNRRDSRERPAPKPESVVGQYHPVFRTIFERQRNGWYHSTGGLLDSIEKIRLRPAQPDGSTKAKVWLLNEKTTLFTCNGVLLTPIDKRGKVCNALMTAGERKKILGAENDSR